ncbi:sensor histidine kinase [Pelagibacterium montanilacus]|uniref:sensor histidine kinase n=1 Tax=Pelagibacterium montanilacus TaxID=2185280 RepID=UPI000F8D5DC7|nr:histidine kinase dimerization/phosphoacceptor domain -containing protein [Pelagibacterium montanilacus]
MRAPTHSKQGERLRALQSYDILDTDREAEFDDIVKLAASICEAPISVVNLIDAERQWFKAETGLGVRETPIDTSICAHAILENDFVEIPDTLADPRLADNPLCTGEDGLRFYAGALLTNEDGLPLGTLCVLDRRPRELTPLQRDAIRVLARQVMAQLDLRRSLTMAETLRKEVDHRVKNSLLSVAAYARLQIRASRSDETRMALEAVHLRIAAVSNLHELLYKTDSGPYIDLGAYVRNLGRHLESLAADGVAVEVDAERIIVDSDEAAAVGTLVNELAANAFKHAFPEGRQGTVSISLRIVEDGLIELTCADDGVGFGATEEPTSGLGLKVAQTVCGQLGCELEMRLSSEGVAAIARFAPKAGTRPN